MSHKGKQYFWIMKYGGLKVCCATATVSCCCLPTPMTLASGGSPMLPLVVHQASSAVTPAGSAHKSRGDNVVRMWVQLKR